LSYHPQLATQYGSQDWGSQLGDATCEIHQQLQGKIEGKSETPSKKLRDQIKQLQSFQIIKQRIEITIELIVLVEGA
jgi:hypothetical protein